MAIISLGPRIAVSLSVLWLVVKLLQKGWEMSDSNALVNEPVDGESYDYIVIGSGFGGGVAAATLAQNGRDVLVLERGGLYPPGGFPRTPLQMSTNFWDPSQRLYGLFDLWSFRSFEAVVSSGVGGGSLIYANVLRRKEPDSYGHGWPSEIKPADLDGHYARVERDLGATIFPYLAGDGDQTGQFPYVRNAPKASRFRDAARRADLRWEPANLAIRFSGRDEPVGEPFGALKDNMHRAPRSTCRLCGECDIGCNSGSKNTIDLTYLSCPELTGKVVHLCEAKWIWPAGESDGSGGWCVKAVRYPPQRASRHDRGDGLDRKVNCFRTKRLVLSAGTLGTTYLLLRNRANLPHLSTELGHRFSGNGDFLGFFTHGRKTIESSLAPVITGMVVGREGGHGRAAQRTVLVQDGGAPVLADWLGEVISVSMIRRLSRVALALARAHLMGAPGTRVSAKLNEALGAVPLARTFPVLGMGYDVPGGVMRLRDGDLAIDWENAYSKPAFKAIQGIMQEMADALDARFIKAPSSLLSRMVTVHPLGGCPMGQGNNGVVDCYGRVHGYQNLFVADGSVLPGPLGVNPSLTIAALASRFSEEWLKS